MAYIYVLAAITAVLSVVVVALENKGILALKYVLKTVASLCFVMIALLSMAKGGYDNWKILVIAGLVFGMLGDIFLSSNNVVADKKTLGVLTIAGGILFTVSDLVLAYYNFGHTEQTKVKYIYMTTYYAAQILFALTLLY